MPLIIGRLVFLFYSFLLLFWYFLSFCVCTNGLVPDMVDQFGKQTMHNPPWGQKESPLPNPSKWAQSPHSESLELEYPVGSTAEGPSDSPPHDSPVDSMPGPISVSVSVSVYTSVSVEVPALDLGIRGPARHWKPCSRQARQGREWS